MAELSGSIQLLSDEYPNLLKKVPSPPKQLFYLGALSSSLFKYCLAVVGSRSISLYGQKVLAHLFRVLSKEITVVSGFMRGVDACAHETAMQYGLKTVAVVPCGIDRVCPDDQRELHTKIVQSGGLILSDLPLGTIPHRWTFVKRNRVVAGLCSAILIVEAASNSGSLITADFARKFGRTVFAVPNSIFAPNSEGVLKLISTFAKPIISGFEINDFFGLSMFGELATRGGKGSDNEHRSDFSQLLQKTSSSKGKILGLLEKDALSADELIVVSGLPPSAVGSEITKLVLQGSVKEVEGRFYVCKD